MFIKTKISKRVVIFILSILCMIAIIAVYAITHIKPDPPKPSDGAGMFDGATKIEITYDGNDYEITSKETINNIILLCREEWADPTKTINKDDCDMFVRFHDTMGSLWIETSTLNAFINTTAVSINPDILDLLKSNMVPVKVVTNQY